MPEPNSARAKTPDRVSAQAERMLREVGARQRGLERAREGRNSFWDSIGVLGVVGWSVTVPSLAGAALGAWIDHRWHGRISWAVSLFLSGLLIGCFAAWKRIGGKPK